MESNKKNVPGVCSPVKCEACDATSCQAGFKNVGRLIESGLAIYLYKGKDDSKQRDRPKQARTSSVREFKDDQALIIHNERHADLKQKFIVSELNKYKSKCVTCRAIIRHVRDLLEEIKATQANEISAICDHCKRYSGAKCKRCLYVLEQFHKRQNKMLEEQQKRFTVWLIKVKRLLETISQRGNICQHKPYKDTSDAAELLNLLEQLKSPIAQRQPEIETFPPEASAEDLAQSKIMLQELIQKLKVEGIPKRYSSEDSLYVSPSQTETSCMCKYLKDRKFEGRRPLEVLNETDIINQSFRFKDFQTERPAKVGPNKEKYQSSKGNVPRKNDKYQSNSENMTPTREKDQSNNENIAPKKEKEQSSKDDIPLKREKDQSDEENIAPKKEKVQSSKEGIPLKREKDQHDKENIAPKREKEQSIKKNMPLKREKDQSDNEKIAPEKAKDQSNKENIPPKKEKDQTIKEKIPLKDEKYQSIKKSIPGRPPQRTSSDLLLKLVAISQKRKLKERAKKQKPIVLPAFGALPEPRKLQRKEEDIISESILECNEEILVHPAEMVQGNKIIPYNDSIEQDSGSIQPLLFKVKNICEWPVVKTLVTTIANETTKSTPELRDTSGIIHYRLSDRKFIENGWTQLPSTKVFRQRNVFKMLPAAHDWFELHKNKREMYYDSGEKLAEIDKSGRGKWFYKNGHVALDYYKPEEFSDEKRYVVYSCDTEKKKSRTILACFDYLGNGVVYDSRGKERLKYNHSEGHVLDPKLGPPSHWKWHTLNDPPILQAKFIDTYPENPSPELQEIINLNERESKLKTKGKRAEQIAADEDMLAIELENFVKEQADKIKMYKSSFKPFKIRMKAVKINEYFSLRVLDQTNIYLMFRNGALSLKLNLGMKLQGNEIIDTELVDIEHGVTTPYDRFPRQTADIKYNGDPR